MIRFINKYICGILLLLLTGYFFSTKDMSNCYDKTIMAEGLGYYAYLPATYIYHDYSFGFFNKVSPKYYCPGFNPPTRNFINEFDGVKLNKYYPGVSLLWLPFFLLAHLLALLFHLPADGYSDIYQYGIAMAGIFYTWLGLKFTKKVLSHYKIPLTIQAITLTTILFGTNLLLYAAGWSAQTHAYSFFLVAAFCWFAIRLLNDEYEDKNYALCVGFVFLALILTVRPQNIAILLLLPFFGLTKLKFEKIIKKHLFSALSVLGMLVAALLVARVCYYWYVQTGKIILNPYTGEHYYFNKPHLMDALFSYRKGWILYTPFVAVGLAGIFFFKEDLKKINLLVFWSLFIFVSSCWWCWTYSPTSFGQRIYIDFYCLIALQAAVLFNYFYERKIKFLAPATALAIIPFCLLQTHQYKIGIIDGDAYTKEDYWRNLFAVHPVAYYPIPPETVTNKEEHFFNFDDKMNSIRTDKEFYSPPASAFICKAIPFSETEKIPLPSFIVPDGFSNIRVTALVKGNPEHVKDESLVIDINHGGKSIRYSGFPIGDYIHSTDWTRVQKGFATHAEVHAGDTATIYFWKAKTEDADTTFIDDLKVEFIHTDKSYLFTR
jgi:hypothetical protein